MREGGQLVSRDVPLEVDRWSLAYGHVLKARDQLLAQPVDPLGDRCFANAVLLDAENTFELLGIAPAVVAVQDSPGCCVESALSLLKDVPEAEAASRVRKILLPFRSESWEG